jgi:hypothetical protein
MNPFSREDQNSKTNLAMSPSRRMDKRTDHAVHMTLFVLMLAPKK